MNHLFKANNLNIKENIKYFSSGRLKFAILINILLLNKIIERNTKKLNAS